MSTCLVRSLRALAADSTKPGASSVIERFLTSHGVFPAGYCQSAAHTSVPELTAANSRAFSAAAAGQAAYRGSQNDTCSQKKHSTFCCAGSRSFHASAAAGALNYYQTLGLPQSAAESEIKKAYYKLAKRYHPDANPDNADAVKKFQEVQEAYDILKDPQKRSMYDQVGHQQFKNSGAGDAGGGFSFHSGAGFGDEAMFDMAKEFFGGGGSRRSSMYSSYQASTSVSISFMESLTGTKRKMSLHLGDGPESQDVEVDVPAGIENGVQLLMQDIVRTQQHRVSLVVQVQVQGHRAFERKGDNIISKLELKLSEALLGCKKEVETAWGTRAIVVPEGTTASSRLTIEGMGAPRLKGSGRGKHILEISLKVPQRLTSEQMKIAEELRKSGL